ncbi:hypothetical protein LCGC14_2517620, partial [marine sediment metagenome]
FATGVPLAAAEQSCCHEVPWGTVTVAVHDGRLITTGGDPQHPSAFALDKVLGDEVQEAVLGAAVLLRTPAPTYAARNVNVKLQVGSSGPIEVKVRDKVVVSREESKPYEPVQLQAEVELLGQTPIRIKVSRPKQGPWLVRVRVERLEEGGEKLHCLCRANVRNSSQHDQGEEEELNMDYVFDHAKSVSLLDGKTLTGWNCSVPKFRVEDGAIVTSGQTNERACYYLLTDKEYGDFELSLKVKMQGGNSGIYIRSHREPGSVDAHGYQLDVGGGVWGMLYDERGTRIIGMTQRSMPPGFEPTGWVECRIRCVGSRIQYWLDGHKTIDHVEEDTQIPQKGSIGLQFHSWSAHPFEVQFKDIRIKELAR